MTLSIRDRQLIWHPFTQEKMADLPIAITRGSGTYLYDEQQRVYLDLISSWWVNLHGHAQPQIAKAIYEQACQLEHVIFAGFTHEPAITLCEKIQALLANHLQRFFFSDNGSTAVEVALKMAYQYWSNQNETQRTLFLSFDGAYHGDTFGAMAVGKGSGFHEHFQKLFFNVMTIPYPATWQDDADIVQKEAHALQALQDILQQHASKIAAFIAEPLLQGASGMRLCRPSFLQQVIDLLRTHNILIIFDEVMTGFGRTGTHFAYTQIQREPDILCLSKGLSGGFLPLALTISTEEIYQAFLGDHFDRAFAHGHSYTANPLGCAAALASLELLLKADTQQAIQIISTTQKNCLNQLKNNLPNLKSLRQLGTMAAFNLFSEETNYHHPLVSQLKKQFLDHGLLIRPLGNTIYFLPPYCITKAQLETAYATVTDILYQHNLSE